MSETRKRYKGLCAFQDRCMFTSDQCKFIHVLTETNLNKAVRELKDEVLKISKLPSFEPHSKDKRSFNVEERQMVDIQTTIEYISTSKDKLDSNKRSEIHTAETDGKSIQSNSIAEEIRTSPEKRKQSQKLQTTNRKKVHSSNKRKVDLDDFDLIRKDAGRYVLSCNAGKQDIDDKKADFKLQTNSHSLLPPNCYNIMEKNQSLLLNRVAFHLIHQMKLVLTRSMLQKILRRR